MKETGRMGDRVEETEEEAGREGEREGGSEGEAQRSAFKVYSFVKMLDVNTF
jgi:hypothetical protein